MYDRETIELISEKLQSSRQTVAAAESVTAGHLQAALSSGKAAGKYFQGGISVYNLGQKCRQLGVEPIHAESTNCVSDKVALEMAAGAEKLFLSDYGLSITGYASKAPDLGIDKLFAWFCISKNHEALLIRKIEPPEEDNIDVQLFYTNEVLREFEKLINKG